jgi:antitoxin HicB
MVENDGVTVTFPDVPEAITGGATREDALDAASDCIDEALAGRICDREAIPFPSPTEGRPTVTPSTLISAKAALYEAMRARDMKNTTLATMLGVREGEVRRMLDPHHPTKIGRLEKALKILGQRLVIALEATDPPKECRLRQPVAH